jgi:phosphatidylglycerophosphate synthase
MAGLSGIARSVILADLEGAGTIYIVAPGAVKPDWHRSFMVRERALPKVVLVDRLEDIEADEARNLIVLPDDRLMTRSGMNALRANRAPHVLAEPQHVIVADDPKQATWRILVDSMKPGEGWVGRNIDRPISFRLSALLMRWDISPNWITWFTLCIAIIMSATLAHGGALSLAVGGALYQLVMVFDCVDGDIARVTYQTGRFGAALDTACDMLANLGFISGLMIGLVRTYGYDELMVVAAMLGVAILCMVLMTLLLRLGPRQGSFDVLRAALAVRLADRKRLLATVLACEKLFKRDFYVLLAASLCVLGFARLVPQLGLAGVCIWLLAILWCSPVIITDKSGALLPSHLRE